MMETTKLLHALAAHWGQAFADMDAGRDPGAVRAEWAAAVAALTPAMIQRALDRLPAQPLTAWGFRAHAVMLTPPDPAPRRTNTPVAAPTAVALRERAKLADIAPSGPRDPVAWARRLQARERAGERLTPTIAAMWRAALKWEGPA